MGSGLWGKESDDEGKEVVLFLDKNPLAGQDYTYSCSLSRR